MPERAAATHLDGVWRPETYVVEGLATPLEGVLLFAEGWWATLYFVPGPGPPGPLASAETGTFALDGDRLTFHHQGLFQGWFGKPLVIEQNERRIEICQATVDANRLTIKFPSGNDLLCRRLQS